MNFEGLAEWGRPSDGTGPSLIHPNGHLAKKLDGGAVGEQAFRAMSATPCTSSVFQSVFAPGGVVVGLISVLGLVISPGAAAD
jgi:hypothetical protein